MRSLMRILSIKWSDRITNNEVLRRAATTSIYILYDNVAFAGGHVRRMQDGRIPKTYYITSSQQAREFGAASNSDSKTSVKET